MVHQASQAAPEGGEPVSTLDDLGDVHDLTNRQLALNAMACIEELLLRGVIRDLIAEEVRDQSIVDDLQMRWIRAAHGVLVDAFNLSADIERGGTS